MKFEEVPPFFFTKQIPDEAVPQHEGLHEAHRPKKRRGEKAGRSIVSAKAVGVCPAIAVVCGKQSSHHSHLSIDQLSGHEALKLVCEASDRGPAHRRCRQEQRLTCLPRCSNCWEQRARENDRGGRTTNMRNLHKRRKGGSTSAIWTSSGKCMGWKAGSRVSLSIALSSSESR